MQICDLCTATEAKPRKAIARITVYSDVLIWDTDEKDKGKPVEERAKANAEDVRVTYDVCLKHLRLCADPAYVGDMLKVNG